MGHQAEIPLFAGATDLASALLGGKALYATDDFFAEKENLLSPGEAIFIPEKMTERGKWMDGWESRRKRIPGHDYCIVKLGEPGVISGVDIDTSHFLGNHSPYGSVDACDMPEETSIETLRDEVEWTEILPPGPLHFGSHNVFAVPSSKRWTHVRLHMYPAGGIARLRVYGDVKPAATRFSNGSVDLLALKNGGKALACSDMFFSPMDNLLAPHTPQSMLDGWETRRRRGPGHDWVILKLARPGLLEELQIDTHYFNGNFPDACSVEGIFWPGASTPSLLASLDWIEVLSSRKLTANAAHKYGPADGLVVARPLTHLRVSIFPDGGISRVRAIGRALDEGQQVELDHPALSVINDASPDECRALVLRCCGSTRFARHMEESRPFLSQAALMGMAEENWWRLAPKDYLEAFTHHPQIGASRDELEKKFPKTKDISGAEQAQVAAASGDILDRLAQKNKEYLEKFGFIFIICATGKSAEEMLQRLEERLPNDPEQEIYIAAGEQAKITRLRLEQLTTENLS
jgi:allantoicase